MECLRMIICDLDHLAIIHSEFCSQSSCSLHVLRENWMALRLLVACFVSTALSAKRDSYYKTDEIHVWLILNPTVVISCCLTSHTKAQWHKTATILFWSLVYMSRIQTKCRMESLFLFPPVLSCSWEVNAWGWYRHLGVGIIWRLLHQQVWHLVWGYPTPGLR